MHFRVSFAFFCWASLASAQTNGIAYTNAYVIPEPGQVIKAGTVAFKDGRLTYVGDGAAPNGYKLIDLKGAWVLPGFMDSAMTRGLKLPDPPLNEVRDDATTVPTHLRPLNRKGVRPDVKASECLDLAAALPDQYGAGFTSAYIMPGVGTFRGQGAIVVLREGEAPVLKSSYGQGMSFSTGVGQGFPSTKFGVMALIRQTLLDTQRLEQFHPTARPKELEPLNSLLAVIQGRDPEMWFVDNANDIIRVAELAGEFGARFGLVGAREAYKAVDLIKTSGAPVIAGVAIGPEPQGSTDARQETPAAYFEQRRERWKEGALNLSVLAKAGIPFALSTVGDATNNFWPNLRKVVELGLPKDVALNALTTTPASLFGVENELGSLKIGKRACVTVFSGDPFEKESKVIEVVVDGKIVEVAH